MQLRKTEQGLSISETFSFCQVFQWCNLYKLMNRIGNPQSFERECILAYVWRDLKIPIPQVKFKL